MKRIPFALVGLLGVALGFAVHADESHVCTPAIDTTTSALGLDRSDITNRQIYAEKTGDSEGVLVGYYAWLRVKPCDSGWLVMNFHEDCELIQAFTDGACRIPGVNPG